MRKLFQILMFVIVVNLAACNVSPVNLTPAETPTLAPNVAEVDRANTVIFDAGDGPVKDVADWNPLGANRRLDHGFHQALMEPLFILNYETGQIEGWLGESMTANDDLTEWTLKLRPAIQWQDGVAFTAKDVVFTVNLLLKYADQGIYSAGMEKWIKSVAQVDDLTVKFVLLQPNPRFQLDYWAVKVWGGPNIVPEHIWKDKEPLTFKNYDPAQGWPIFTGPYKLKSVTAERVEYTRDDNWWGAQSGWKPLPKPLHLAWTALGDEATRSEAMANGQLDSIVNISLDSFLQIKRKNPQVITHFDKLPYAWVPDPCSRTLDFNTAKAPWDDKAMRWAVNYALDRAEIVAFAYNDTTIPSRHFFPVYPALDNYVNLLETSRLYDRYPLLEHSAIKAKAAIEKNGYRLNNQGMYEKAGQKLSLTLIVSSANSDVVAIAEVVVRELTAAGISSQVELLDNEAWFHQLAVGDFEATIGWQSCGSVNEPWASMDTFNTHWLKPLGERTGEGQNNWRWSGEAATKYSEIVDEIGSLPLGDPKIEPLFTEAMELWFAELPAIPLTQARMIIPFDTTYWTGWPTAQNNYAHPPTWWQSTHLIIHNLQPVR